MPTSPPQSPAPSGIVRPSTRSGSRMSMSSTGRQLASGIMNGAGRAPSRASGEEDDGMRTAIYAVMHLAVRIRPSLQPSDPGYDLVPQRFQRSMVQTMNDTSLTIDSPQGRKIFVFDRIFGPDVQQDGVWDYLQDSITAFAQGYNVSILAYGQSGAGKSYTMGTSDPNERTSHDVSGVIPRAAVALFEKLSPISKTTSGIKTPSRYSTPLPNLQRQPPQEKPWSMKATYVEIYNEQLRDLLLPETTPLADRRQVNIREDTRGRILLTGLQEMPIESVDDLLAALNFGSSIRQTDSTAINAKSSRSHAVFSINLVQRKPRAALGRDIKEKRYSAPADILASGADGYVTVDSKLHFVDLAGSERLKNTGAHGDRAKEGISINAGLASLGKVISQLSSRQAGSHVSYRDSKLTRLLQDSLGGNAFTYMVACVNPAEFHLSETLNTVQYAQRARAIQSKPQIQEVAVDGDMRALVERLRTEIAFLRDQVRVSEASTSRSNRHSVDRSTEKEVELQNQLLDVQENYSALSQRHAKLISEITKARDSDSNPPSVRSSDVVEDRIARSNSFAEAVEQVVLEYEKTIQSLEASLSSTRSNLSVTEGSLLEKESRLVYLETINSQLQTRVQRLADRESSTEVYLADLENRLNGHTFGEERNSAAISELRKELTRVRENEASCEDYISTLEERLAEADQSMEIMQRELERLEHVVERQRSLGKLDNLLHELDTLTHAPSQTGSTEPTIDESTNAEAGAGNSRGTEEIVDHSGAQTIAIPIVKTPNAFEVTAVPIAFDPLLDDGNSKPRIDFNNQDPEAIPGQQVLQESPEAGGPEWKSQLERTNRELKHFKDLYQSTMGDYTEMAARYEGALRDLHELQDQLDEHRHGRSSLVISSTDELPPPSPQSVSSPFISTPLVQQISNLSGHTESDMQCIQDSQLASNGAAKASLNQVIRDDTMDLGAEFNELEARYLSLQDEHRSVLELVDELKSSISKSRLEGVMSPTGAQMLRRKSSQNLVAVDRANRAFKGLRSIAIQYLSENEDVREVFDLNINAALHELQSRSERIQELEHEVTGLRKDAEAKTAMINGLARERSSITSSPMDISVVSSLQSRLAESEDELQKAHSKLKAQEEEFQQRVLILRSDLEEAQEFRSQEVRDTTPTQESTVISGNHPVSHPKKAGIPYDSRLEELLQMVEDERALPLIENIDSIILLFDYLLENTYDFWQDNDGTQWISMLTRFKSRLEASRNSAFSQQQQLADYKETLEIQLSRINDILELLPVPVDLNTSPQDPTSSDFAPLSTARPFNIANSRIKVLLDSLNQHNAKATMLQDELETEKTEVIRYKETIVALKEKLASIEDKLEKEAKVSEDRVTGDKALQDKTVALGDLNHKLQSELDGCIVKNRELSDEVVRYKKDLDAQKSLVVELQELHAMSQKELSDLIEKEATHAGVIDQLEQQLTSTYDQHHDAQKRLLETEDELRALQSDRVSLLASHEAAAHTSAQHMDSLMNELNALQLKLADAQLELTSLPPGTVNRTQRSNSVSSTNLRKSASTASLPSPPPIIPLPPLPPTQVSNSSMPGVAASGQPIPPSTPTVSRRPSKDYVVTHLEDQEARIKTLEKQLQAEKALTATLEEALTDCEKTMKKINADKDMFQRKANQAQQELDRTRNESQSSRYSMQAMEDERLARLRAEKARQQLEERMQELSKQKKSRNFACF
ncbi:hypothetical protein H072_9973 [Dactylellina haptotyla CBS 200.50]|uniref:Kinesin motor domain-containing protein n=1 Tax=Dactylellina haptotyla (strain CBS 200.50) TaxID=1284197 RepID=S8A1B4_DACHA|nr:hypothetical protein H072_9973 [Dactylellina haptotyla CBS 200.50]